MAYEPTNWKSGDVVTSAKLNKLEQGVVDAGGGALVVTANDVTGAFDKTWQEINDALIAGKRVYVAAPYTMKGITVAGQQMQIIAAHATGDDTTIEGVAVIMLGFEDNIVAAIATASAPEEYPVFAED